MTINPNQFHSGPAGALTGCELELVHLFGDLAEINNQYAQDNIAVDSIMGGAAAAASIASGNAQRDATIAQACQSAVDAGITAASSSGTLSGADKLAGEHGRQTDALKPITEFNETLQSTHSGPEIGLSDEDQTALRENPDVQRRLEELKSPGGLSRTDVSGTGHNSIEDLNAATIKAMRPEERAACVEMTQREILSKNTSINDLSSQISSMTNRNQQYGQVGTGAANCISQSFQASSQAQQGQAQAAQSMTQNNAQMASSMLGTVAKNNSDWFGMIASVLQTLRAAGSAYAA